MDEWESKSVLAAYGIPVPRGVLAASRQGAIDAAASIGGRVVMKGVASDIHHKTEAGLVVLGVEGAEAVDSTYRLLEGRAAGALEGVLVEQMVAADREFMVGMTRDSAFGPVVAFGLGGVLTEALGDVALAVAPLSERDAATLPDLIRAKKLLGPFRGYPEVDRTELAKILVAVAQIALDNPQVAEIDVNPLLIDGGRPIAADALVILSTGEEVVRESRTFKPNLKAVLAPESVAIVGASEDVAKWGGSALRNIVDGGYTGRIYPVNPKGGRSSVSRPMRALPTCPRPPIWPCWQSEGVRSPRCSSNVRPRASRRRWPSPPGSRRPA